MSEQKPELNQRKPFSGMRVLIAVAIGAGLGLAVAYFLKVLIDNSPAEIDLSRLRLFSTTATGITAPIGRIDGLLLQLTHRLNRKAPKTT